MNHNRSGDNSGSPEDTYSSERYFLAEGPVVVFTWLAAPGWPVKHASANVQALFGYSAEELTSGRVPYASVIHPDDLARVQEQVTATIARGGDALERHYRIVRADGTITHLHDVTRVRRDEYGNATHFDGYVLDVSENAAAVEALRLSEQRLRGLFEQAAVGIAEIDISGRFLNANPALCSLVGRTLEELRGLTFRDITYPADLDSNIALQRRVLAGEASSFAMEKRYLRSDGAIIWALLSVSLIRGSAQRPERFISVITDITQRKVLEERLRVSEHLEGLGRLAGGVAHDFNNLLTVIAANASAILNTTPGAPSLHAREILAAAAGASGLTRQLLAFARRQVNAPTILDLPAAVSESLALVRRLLREDIALHTDLRPDAGAVRADPVQLQQILLNLAANAQDATPAGGSLFITVAAADMPPGAPTEGPAVVMVVRDTGAGMDDQTRRHAFEPFFTTKPADKGTGLGLASVYGIVRQAGGEILLQSAPGQGSEFQLYWPRAELLATGVPGTLSRGNLAHSAGVILVAEDQALVRSVLTMSLRSAGYTVLEADDGLAALALGTSHRGPIHLLLTDSVMPSMSGPELAERLRAERPDLRVLLISGYTEDDLARQAVDSGAFSFLPKPFTPDELLDRVAEILHAPASAT